MATTNQKLAAIFTQMADLMQVLGVDSFKVIAMQRAARVLDELTDDVAELAKDPKKLLTIPGVGKGTAGRIHEFITTGSITDHQQLLAQVPPGVLELLGVPGLGPKTVALFWKQAGITSSDELKKALTDQPQKLLALPGMGEKKLDNLRKSMNTLAAVGERRRIGKVFPLARWLVSHLSAIQGVQQVQFAGSLRRGKETIGDLDLLVAAQADDAQRLMQSFVALFPSDVTLIGMGDTKCSLRTSDGLQVDLRIVPPASYGAALLYFTGSKEHNVQMRQRAIDRGYKLNEYGLFKGEALIAGGSENDIFKALGLTYIPPELREARGEIALAENSQLPRLLELSDIRAELHAHTKASDGKLSIRELVLTALDRGFHTIAVTDHSVSQTVAHGLNAQRLEEHIVEVRRIADEFKGRIQVLAGSEVDILSDGRLDYPNSLLKQLDIVVASPHSALNQDPLKATLRLRKAIENPYVTIMGHPTGRLIGRREGMSPEWKELITAAKERRIAMEINANSHRLDLRDTHARAVREAGVKLAINTDAHGSADFDELIYGVLTARRAGASKDDVVNTFDQTSLNKWLAATRA